eukprot:COSAG02_NODE_9568_length_2177_cov_1.125120_1_plen_422_part_00
MYSLTLGTLRTSLMRARAAGANSMVLLGDLVDDRDRAGDAAAAEVLETAEVAFRKGQRRVQNAVGYVLGNHDTKWTQTFRAARRRGEALDGHFAWECEIACEEDYTEGDEPAPPWVCLALDCYATSQVPMGEQVHPNGAVGSAQLEWLRQRLAAAQAAGRSVIILSHTPLHPRNSLADGALDLGAHGLGSVAAFGGEHTGKYSGRRRRDTTLSVTDSSAVLEILQQHARCVRLCVAGHDHAGAYCIDNVGIHYATLPACLAVDEPGGCAGAVLRCYSGRVELMMLADGSRCVVTGGSPRALISGSIRSKPQLHEPEPEPQPELRTQNDSEFAPKRKLDRRQKFKQARKTSAEKGCESGQRICFDMETGDPDDVLALLLILAHPRLELRAVTLTPGTREQVRKVKEGLPRCMRTSLLCPKFG